MTVSVRSVAFALLAALGCAFLASAGGATEPTFRASVYAVRDDGSGLRLIASPEPPVSALVRSPGGRSILFTREVDGVLALFAADLSGANAVRLSPPGISTTISYPAARSHPMGAPSPSAASWSATTDARDTRSG